MLSGANHDAATALSLGVVDEVVASDRVLERAIAVARDYARLPAQTFAETKCALRAELLERLVRVDEDGSDPMLDGWFTAETERATRDMLASLRQR